MSTETAVGERTRPARAAARPENRSDSSGPGRSPRSRAESAARARVAAELAAAGLPYAEVSARLDYATPASAHRAAAKASATRAVNTASSTRETILPILDRIIDSALSAMLTGRPRMYRGKPILTDPSDPTSTIPDWRYTFRMADIVMRAMDQQAKLLGLYASQPGPQISRNHPYR